VKKVREATGFGFAGPARRMTRGWALTEYNVAKLLKSPPVAPSRPRSPCKEDEVMAGTIFNWLDGTIYGEEFERIRACVLVDVNTGKIYVAVEDSCDAQMYEGELLEWHTPAGVWELVEATNYQEDPDPWMRGAPPHWWCRRVERLPESCVPVAAKYRRPPVWNVLPDE
jgi:hypothetical protein